MSFDWGAYVRLSHTLSAAAPTFGDPVLEEAALRAAISRSYYGAFGRSFRRYSDLWDTMTREEQLRTSVHAWLYDRYLFYSSQNATASAERKRAYRRIADDLKMLRDYRTEADYRSPNMADPNRTAAAALRLANRILQQLEANPPISGAGT